MLSLRHFHTYDRSRLGFAFTAWNHPAHVVIRGAGQRGFCLSLTVPVTGGFQGVLSGRYQFQLRLDLDIRK